MSLTWITIAILLFLFIIKIFLQKTNRKLPPGPTPFPIIGSLHLLGKHPHRQLQKLSQKYGPIMHLRLGLKHAVFISSPEAAELFLKTHDSVFSTDPIWLLLAKSSKIVYSTASKQSKNSVFQVYEETRAGSVH